jgi:hypothetical protein
MKKNIIAMAMISMLLLSSFMITPTLALGSSFTISDPEPTNTSKDVDIYQQTVSVFISSLYGGPGSTPENFDWEIGGDHVNTNSSSYDGPGRIEAKLKVPLPENTSISWYVCVKDNKSGKELIKETFSFKTEEQHEPPIIAINITNPDPANESIEIPVILNVVSVYIEAERQIQQSSEEYLAFNWTIGGDNISTTSGYLTSPATVTADIMGPLYSNTIINWYVNVNVSENGEKTYKNATFWFKTFNNRPVANFTNTTHGLKVDFDGSLSYDSDGAITNYTWYFGDLNISYGNTAQHPYDKDGSYNVRLKVTDDAGKTGNKTIPVNVKNSLPKANFKPSVDGKKVTFDASLSSDEDGTIENEGYTWNFDDGKECYGKIIDHTYVKEDETYTVTLKVTDNKGNYSEINISVRINDTTKPIVKIVKPVKKGIYVNNETKRSRILGMTLIIGGITIEVSATDENGSGIKEVKFYGGLLGKLYLGNDTTAPYSFNWVKGRIRFIHMQIIKVVAYDNAGNSATAKMIVKKYL